MYRTLYFTYTYRATVVRVCVSFPLCCSLTLQAAYKRSFACIMMLAAVDDEKGPQLFKVDPAGHVLGYKVRTAVFSQGLIARRLNVAESITR